MASRNCAGDAHVECSKQPWRHRESHAPDGAGEGLRNQQAILSGPWVSAFSERLFEMQLGTFSFILQDYYIEDWANNFVMHVLVTDLDRWWQQPSGLDLPGRYGVNTLPPKQESWGVVAGVVDPCGVLWRFAQARTS